MNLTVFKRDIPPFVPVPAIDDDESGGEEYDGGREERRICSLHKTNQFVRNPNDYNELENHITCDILLSLSAYSSGSSKRHTLDELVPLALYQPGT